jgi:hypothetical protein
VLQKERFDHAADVAACRSSNAVEVVELAAEMSQQQPELRLRHGRESSTASSSRISSPRSPRETAGDATPDGPARYISYVSKDTETRRLPKFRSAMPAVSSTKTIPARAMPGRSDCESSLKLINDKMAPGEDFAVKCDKPTHQEATSESERSVFLVGPARSAAGLYAEKDPSDLIARVIEGEGSISSRDHIPECVSEVGSG